MLVCLPTGSTLFVVPKGPSTLMTIVVLFNIRYVWKRSLGRSVQETNSLRENEWKEELPRRPEPEDVAKVN